jgi:cob(I)alamin adenosyltransferase
VGILQEDRLSSVPRESIVTKRGDGGETGLLYGGRVRKTDPRTEAYGAIDEAISSLGLARAMSKNRGHRAIAERVQSELFTVGAELATDADEYEKLRKHFLTVTPEFTERLEKEIAELEERVALPAAFVVPGGNPQAAAFDVARSVLRRAERRVVALSDAGSLLNAELLRYLNRLSDLLFMLARAEEKGTIQPVTGRRRRPQAPPRIRGGPRRQSRS